ncbi:MAG TPA: sulfatase-like hydrolase/transferase [Thermoanaerobaculia bacterium]|nr:sulfatase-like hydrolase/transferase [Thermoanaerobaculia bacterium]
MRLRLLLLLPLALMACHQRETPAPSADKPDIILVTIDTLRADSVGFAGNTNVKTPFLDKLAQEGIVFANAHAHNVITLPSHTNILTGLYPYQHGVRENAGYKLSPKFETVATMLHRAGYTTGAFIGAYPLDSRYGLNQGFDVYDDNYGKGETSLDFSIQERPASAVLDAAAKWWRGNAGKKRFLWIHLYDPHAPYRPPEPFATQYAADPYLGEIAAVDDALGRQLAPLLESNPLLIVTADHGEGRGDHGELTHGLFAYEATLKVPLIVHQNGVIKHRLENGYVRHIDIVPTILERAGVAKPDALLGASLLESGVTRDSYFESLSAAINRGWAPLTGVIRGSEKYIDLPISELYDLPRDPAEKNNLRDAQRRDVEAARQLLASFHAQFNAPNRDVSAEEKAKLRSLGYISGSASMKTSYTAADDPKNLVQLDNEMHQVVDAYERHDMATALKLARHVVETRPDMAAGRELLAFVLQQSGRVPEAIDNLRAAINTGQETTGTRVQLGLLLTESGKIDEAVQVLAPLAASNDPDALNAYGVALSDQGHLDEGVKQFERVLESDPNNAPALQNLGVVALRRDDVNGAMSYLTKALALNPRLALALNTLGVVYARQGDYARAVESWNRAVDIDPRQYDALFNIGLVEGRAGHRAEAKAALSRFIATAPKDRYGDDLATARQALASLQ